MEIDARFPAPQAVQTTTERALGEGSVPPVAVGAGSEFFISPVLRFDSRSLTVIFQVRDSRSGDVIRQFPPETVVARYREDQSAKPFVLPAPGAPEAGERAQLGRAEPGIVNTSSDSGRDPAAPPPAGEAEAGGPSPEAVDLVA